VYNCQVKRIGECHRRTVLASCAMAAGAVFAVERHRVEDGIRPRHLGARLRLAGQTGTTGEGKQHGEKPAEEEPSPHRRSSSPSRSWIMPGASMPARIASGKFSDVHTLFWRTTTRPATMPNPICDAANHHQLIRSSISGFTKPMTW